MISVEEGWNKFVRDVLAKKFPDYHSPEYDGLRTLAELTYHSGAAWVMGIMKTERLSESTYNKIRAELDEYFASIRERGKQ
jgi:hypothetical protein